MDPELDHLVERFTSELVPFMFCFQRFLLSIQAPALLPG
jgi:hypothetical protein